MKAEWEMAPVEEPKIRARRFRRTETTEQPQREKKPSRVKITLNWEINRSCSCGILLKPSHEEGTEVIIDPNDEELLFDTLNRMRDENRGIVNRYLKFWGVYLPEIKTNNSSGLSTNVHVIVEQKVTVTKEEIEPNRFQVKFHPKGVWKTWEFDCELYVH